MNKLKTILSIVCGLIIIANYVLKYLLKLTTPILHLNWLEIIGIIIFVILIYEFLPRTVRRRKLQSKAENFYKTWIDFKNILTKYSKKPNPNLQDKYSSLREKMVENFSFFVASIKSIQEKTHRRNTTELMHLFDESIGIIDISNWAQRMRSRVGEYELNVFDHFIIGLKEHYKNPENFKNL